MSYVKHFFLALLCISSVIGQDGLDGLANLAKAFGGASAGQQCAMTCEPGQRLVPIEEGFRPYANGCSVPEFIQLNEEYKFEEGCNQHDACYMACGVAKGDCESRFKRILKRLCKTHHEQELKGCMQMAEVFTAGVTMFGCNGFISSQQEGCGCVPESESFDRFHAYLTSFFKEFNPEKLREKENYVEELLESKKWKGREGELIASLYRKYPESVEVIATDGQARRPKAKSAPSSASIEGGEL